MDNGSFSLYKNSDLEANIIDIYELMKQIPEDSTVKYAFFTSYDGMDFRTLEKILLRLPKGNEFISNGYYDVFCGKKAKLKGLYESFLSELLLEHLHRVLVTGAFHPKIYCIEYGKSDVTEIFLVIASKNITESVFLDSYICLRGEVRANKAEKNNGEELRDILLEESFGLLKDCKKHSDSLNKFCEFCERLAEYQFELWDKNADLPKISFHRPDKELLKEINKEDHELIVVSPFISDSVIKKTKLILYSNKSELEKLNKIDEGIRAYSWGVSEDNKNGNEQNEGEFPIDSLHAKIYVKNDGKNTKMYIGSANYTSSAFSSNNAEILVCATYGNEKYKEIKEEFNNPVWKLWKKPKDQESGAVKQHIAANIYSTLENISVRKSGQKWEYTLSDGSSIAKGTCIQIYGKSITITDITPTDIFPATRNVEINFLLTWKENEEELSESGAITLDIFDLVDDSEKESLQKRIKARISDDLKARKQCLLRTGKAIRSEIKTNKEKSDSKKMKRYTYRKGVPTGLFEALKVRNLYDENNSAVDFIKSIESQAVGDEGKWTVEEKILVRAITGEHD